MCKVYFFIFGLIFCFHSSVSQVRNIYIHPEGNDAHTGSIQSPMQSLNAAFSTIQHTEEEVDSARIILLPGIYRLNKPLNIGPDINYLSIEAESEGTAIVKGSKQLENRWESFRNGIYQAKTNFPISPFAQLYVNGKEQILARYPNYDSTASHYDGYAADAIDPERVVTWKNPEGAIVHVMHRGEWGGFHYIVKSTDKKGKVELEGGHQNNRPSPMHAEYRMVENVFEELDSPGEWYFDSQKSILYLFPHHGVNLNNSNVEVTTLNSLVKIVGTKDNPSSNIHISGISFEHTNRTFMEDYEPLLRSDWMIYRGGAIFFENTESCSVSDCNFTNLGGNVIFNSGFVRANTFEGNHIYNCGASAISFVGSPDAVRSPSFNYNEFVAMDQMDLEKGPQSDDYPSNCAVKDNLIHDIGLVEKQVAGVQISMAMNITISHNSIYDLPRSGINVSEGTWGGHIIEHNDVFNTVLETSDHGAFNSWGRDRFWHPDRKKMDAIIENNPEMPYLDAMNTTIIRNNRMRCDHGWDIDLDDGSSNYHIYNNLCLNGGIKLREGLYRKVENNIMVNNGFHPHVWFINSQDEFVRNIVMTDHKDIRLQGWGKEVDFNLFPDNDALKKAHENGTDKNSLAGDPEFVDPENGDFRVAETSPALELGFINFPMNKFGVQKIALKTIAKQPTIPKLLTSSRNQSSSNITRWLGADIKNIETIEERSAAGLTDTSGVLIIEVQDHSQIESSNLKQGEVIVGCEGKPVRTVKDLLGCYQGNNWKGQLSLTIVSDQNEKKVIVKTK